MSREETDRSEARGTTDTDADHFDMLFEIASRGDLKAEEATGLDASDKEQIEEIRSVLRMVDVHLPVTAADVDEVEAHFLRLLAEEEPDNPWVSSLYQENTEDVEVKTVGDMVRLISADSPIAVSQQVLKILFQSTTPISDLADTAKRPAVLGPIFNKAGVPPAKIPEIFQWMNVSMNSMLPGQHGAFVARRQKKKPGSSR